MEEQEDLEWKLYMDWEIYTGDYAGNLNMNISQGI